ncbi:MAG: hypothetical protein JWQ18_326, partial [Conexibacter sp.]|nr:hypothetical protein [Conexibacter sp.]
MEAHGAVLLNAPDQSVHGRVREDERAAGVDAARPARRAR